MSKAGSTIRQFDDFSRWLEDYDYTKVSEHEFEIFCSKVEKLNDLLDEILDCIEPTDDEGADDENL